MGVQLSQLTECVAQILRTSGRRSSLLIAVTMVTRHWLLMLVSGRLKVLCWRRCKLASCVIVVPVLRLIMVLVVLPVVTIIAHQLRRHHLVLLLLLVLIVCSAGCSLVLVMLPKATNERRWALVQCGCGGGGGGVS